MGLIKKYWRCCADFSGRTERWTYWKTMLTCWVLGFTIMLLDAVFSVMILRTTTPLLILFRLYSVLWILTLPAMTVRRLRDAGYSPKSLFWICVPGIGAVALLARLCMKSKIET
ncbi:MAG: DUF805 domain-containing protein [Oscillospiraceae bacterium]|nr:DUF805 domain-containing protein [Oscillospiraceae bacterium]